MQFELWKLLFFEDQKGKKTPITKGGAGGCFFPHFFASCLKPVICVTFSRDFKYGQIELHGCLLLIYYVVYLPTPPQPGLSETLSALSSPLIKIAVLFCVL